MRLVLLSLAAILASAVREAFFHAFVVNIVVHDEMGFNTEAFKAKKSDCSLLLGFLDCGLRIPTPSGFGFDVCERALTAGFSDATGIREGPAEEEFR